MKSNSSALLLQFLLFLRLQSSSTYALTAAFRKRSPQRSSNRLYMSRPDSSAAVQEALRVTKELGSTSKEARLAWETVEEIDSADMSPAIATATVESSEVHSNEYKVQVLALNRLLVDTQEKLQQIKALASNLKELDIDDPSLSKLPDSASGLKTVLQEAKAATEVYGPDSKEADAAWNEVDFCTDVMGGVECNVDSMYRYSSAALNAHHVYDAVVDATFFEEAEDAIEMLQNLSKFVKIEAKRLGST